MNVMYDQQLKYNDKRNPEVIHLILMFVLM